jgi:phosphoglycolate phosphatase-like HAD superfamily hydrolase
MTLATVLFWDIDGTLLTTARAGILAWEGAIEETLGRPQDLTGFETAGLTDVQIAAQLLREYTVGASPDGALAMLKAYERRLPSSLGTRVGRVLPHVRAILEALRRLPAVHSMLLTGNTSAGAAAKLRHYGLAEFFENGAFSDGTIDRPSVARNALALARRLVGEIAPEQVYVIGDTPHDIECGHAIGARVIAVATGVYSVDELSRHGPWWTIPQLPPAAEFISRLGLEARD